MIKTDMEKIDGAINAHITWKKQFDSALVAGLSNLSIAEVASDRGCKLGKLIYSDGVSVGLSCEKYGIPEIHKKFHHRSSMLLEYMLSHHGGEPGYFQVLRAYEQSSTDLVNALREWKNGELRALLCGGAGSDISP